MEESFEVKSMATARHLDGMTGGSSCVEVQFVKANIKSKNPQQTPAVEQFSMWQRTTGVKVWESLRPTERLKVKVSFVFPKKLRLSQLDM